MTIENGHIPRVTVKGFLPTLKSLTACIGYVFEHVADSSKVASIHITCDEPESEFVNIYWTERKEPFLHVNIAEDNNDNRS